MDLTEALTFVDARNQGVLATIRANGRPQLSNIHLRAPATDGSIHISITDGRAKTANLRTRPQGLALRAG